MAVVSIATSQTTLIVAGNRSKLIFSNEGANKVWIQADPDGDIAGMSTEDG